jgi:5-methylthioadenosine/S-adenosylhomocysteine deaminase
MSMTSCDSILTCDVLVTCDENGTILHDAAIAISEGKILALGPKDDILQKYSAETKKELSRSLVLPGLVNTHTHASMTLLRGIADDLPLMEWLTKHIWPAEKNFGEEQMRVGSLLACAEMIRTGTTLFTDMYFHEKHIADVVHEVGMRAYLGEGVLSFPTPSYDTPAQGMEMAAKQVEYTADMPLVDACVAVHAVYTVEPDLLQESWALAEKHDLPWTIHLSETEHEVAQCLEQYGNRPPAHLDKLGLLSERTLLAHCVHLNQEEIELLAERGCKVAHQPESNMKLASGAPDITAMLEAGICVGLGSDGAASNNDLNMFTEMTSAALLQKVTRMDPTAMKAEEVLHMATRKGAACLGRSDFGSLAPGKSADLCVLDLTQPNLMPMYHPVSHIVFAANGLDVRMTMVAGKILYEDGVYHSIDFEGLISEAEAMRRWILQQAS